HRGRKSDSRLRMRRNPGYRCPGRIHSEYCRGCRARSFSAHGRAGSGIGRLRSDDPIQIRSALDRVSDQVLEQEAANGSATASTRSQFTNGKENSMTRNRDRGIIDTPTNHSVDETVEKLKGILQAKGVTLFALVDHSGEAEKVEMKMRPTKLLIFGSPKAGTPVMLAAPSSAIDLPLKILIWEDAQGKVWVSYNSPVYLQETNDP